MPNPANDLPSVLALPFIAKATYDDPMLELTFRDGSVYSICVMADEYPRAEAQLVAPFSEILPRPGNLAEIARQVESIHQRRKPSAAPAPFTERAAPKVLSALERDIVAYTERTPGGSAKVSRAASASVLGEWIDVTLPIRGILDPITASAWGFSNSDPLTCRLKFLGDGYLDCSKAPEVEIRQNGESFPAGQQIGRIIKAGFFRWWSSRHFDPSSDCLKTASIPVAASTMGQFGAEFTAVVPHSPQPHASVSGELAPLFRDGVVKNPSDLPRPKRDVYQQLRGIGYDSDRALICAQIASSVEEATDFTDEQLAMYSAQLEHTAELNNPSKKPTKAAVAGDSRPPEQNTTAFTTTTDADSVTIKRPDPYDPDAGFLSFLHQYIKKRLLTLNRFCVICDEPHLFSAGMKPCVCVRNVCAFAFQELHVGEDAASGMATDAGVIDLLVNVFKSAARSARSSSVLAPFPHVFHPSRKDTLILDPKAPDYTRAKALADVFPSIANVLGSQSIATLRQSLDRSDAGAFPLLQWIIASNRAHLVKLDPSVHLKSMKTPHQFLLVMSAPDKQAKFQALKKGSGTRFMFHGSPTENWHAILRNGLRVMSGTTGQLNGAAHGKGVYFAPNAGTSIDYCRPPDLSGGVASRKPRDTTADHFISESRGFICLALCEVVESTIKDHGWCSTVEEEDAIMTRFLFVYDSDKHSEARTVNAGSIQSEIDCAKRFYGVA